MKKRDSLKIYSSERLEFEKLTAGFERTMSDPLEITDGWDTGPRPLGEIDPSLTHTQDGVAYGHIAFMGDFETPKE